MSTDNIRFHPGAYADSRVGEPVSQREIKQPRRARAALVSRSESELNPTLCETRPADCRNR